MAAEPLWMLDAVSLEPARLHELSVEIHPGITAVIGWSGAGKTSLLNLLVGFERAERGSKAESRRPNAAEISKAPAASFGSSLRSSTLDLPSSLAWVPQNGGLWPHCTAREHLTLAGASAERAAALLAAFDLEPFAESRPDALSQGERSRLAVARALAFRAEVLVMDEPLVHVDPARCGKYWAVIREQLEETGASLVFSTHVPETVLAHAQRAICLRHGRLLHEGPVSTLYADPPTSELMTFLGPGNWLTEEESRLWFGLRIDAPRCFRPEQVEITPAAISHVVVRHSTFFGSVADVELRHVNAAEIRSFLHRPSGPHLAAGTPATLHLRE
ncbi:MAG TPA: ATP-binding cassette domain-containing protein [Chthoniobacteraceae bacterium]